MDVVFINQPAILPFETEQQRLNLLSVGALLFLAVNTLLYHKKKATVPTLLFRWNPPPHVHSTMTFGFQRTGR
jgi:hypothetical protein